MTLVYEFLYCNEAMDNKIVEDILDRDEPTRLIAEFNRRAERLDDHIYGAIPFKSDDLDEVAATIEMMDSKDKLAVAIHDLKTMMFLTEHMIKSGDDHFMLALPILVERMNDLADVGRKPYDRMFDRTESGLEDMVQMNTPLMVDDYVPF